MKDWLTIYLLPRHLCRQADFAFLVHPRDFHDIYKPFPFFRYLGERFTHWISWFLPPIVLSHITGVKGTDGKPLRGLLIAIVKTPAHMKERPEKCVRHAIQAGVLAEKRGAKWIGLGAYLPFLTRYGEFFVGKQVDGKYQLGRYTKGFYTTGHSMAAHVIAQYTQQAIELKLLTQPTVTVAIVGAAGSTGTACSKRLVVNNGNPDLLLVDLPKKQDKLEQLAKDLAQNYLFSIKTAVTLEALKTADIVIVVTTAPGTIIRAEDLKAGAIVIDDSQPRNTAPELLQERPDVTVVDVLAQVPGIDCHFDFDLAPQDPSIVFTCLAEVVALAANRRFGHLSIGFIGLKQIQETARLAHLAHINKAPLCSFGHLVTVGRNDTEKFFMANDD